MEKKEKWKYLNIYSNNKILKSEKATLISVPYDNEELKGFRFFMPNKLIRDNQINGKTFTLNYKDSMNIKLFRQEKVNNRWINVEERIITGIELKEIFSKMDASIRKYYNQYIKKEDNAEDEETDNEWVKKCTIKLTANMRKSCWEALLHSGLHMKNYSCLEEAIVKKDVQLIEGVDHLQYAFCSVGLFPTLVRVHDGILFDALLEINYIAHKMEHYKLPELQYSFDARNKYGYTCNVMLPLSKNKAEELFDRGFTIYILYPDNTEKELKDKKYIEKHKGLFGIDKDEWYRRGKYVSRT